MLSQRIAAYAPAHDAADVADALNALKRIAAHEEAEKYAGRVIAEFSGSGPATVAPFWCVLLSAGMPTQALELAQRSDEGSGSAVNGRGLRWSFNGLTFPGTASCTADRRVGWIVRAVLDF
ncbi:hypothetical protein [Actinomadura terrae]|uniref:hypothetical protein n=1 Tax=Actinomadura terrae TaxID=604353 RepID=UPI001FA78953|nr:hypothetical protein [Actinomadura terrae]